MYLQDLIKVLKKYDPDTVVKEGFGNPHSYRGYYDELAFVPEENVRIGDMLKSAKSAVGATYPGWKGGYYTMDMWTPTHLAEVGDMGDALSARLLKYMLNDIVEESNV